MKYLFCGKLVTVKDNNVYRDGNWIGNLFVDEHDVKHVLGPQNKGVLNPIDLIFSITVNGITYEPEIINTCSCESCALSVNNGKSFDCCGNICNTFECLLNVSNVIMKKR